MTNKLDNKNIKNKSAKTLLKDIYLVIKPYRIRLFLGFVAVIALTVLELIPQFSFQYIIGLLENPTMLVDDKTKYIILIIGGLLLVFTTLPAIMYFNNILIAKIGQEVIVDMRSSLYMHILGLSSDILNQIPVGKLVSRISNDTNTISAMYSQILVNLIANILKILIVLILLIVISPIITGFIVLASIVIWLFAFTFKRFSKKIYRNVKSSMSNLNAFLAENLSGMRITQIFNQEDRKIEEFREKNNKLRKLYMKDSFMFAVFFPSIYILTILSTILMFYIAFRFLNNYSITSAKISSYYLLLGNLFGPIQWITNQFSALQDSISSVEKIEEVKNLKPSIVNVENPIKNVVLKFDIEFKNVWFAYEEENWILKDVSFKIKKGQTTAFVGQTGSGKTTILNLIAHNYEAQKGDILIDNINIKEIDINTLRSQIGQMLQDVFLFNDTIKNNIVLNNENITQEMLIQASKYVGADKIIEKLDNKYEHIVLERGNNFSSGERQLISFARTIVFSPGLLILDEATSNIDSETEKIVQQSLYKMMKDHTMLIVAHRLSTIQHSDNIIVIEKGQISEQGSHQELLKNKSIYYNLYQMQFDNKDKK